MGFQSSPLSLSLSLSASRGIHSRGNGETSTPDHSVENDDSRGWLLGMTNGATLFPRETAAMSWWVF